MLKQQNDLLNFHRPPILGRRLKWMMVLLTTAVVVGTLIEHWWNNWVRHGLGW